MVAVRDYDTKIRGVRFLEGLLSRRRECKTRVSEGDRWSVSELIDINPHTYHFGTATRDDLCRLEGPKVIEILDGCNLTGIVRKRLNSREGYFDEIESRNLFHIAVDYVVDDVCTEYIDDEYPKDGDQYVWALGIILCYLLCGYPALKNTKDKQCYDNIGIGPPSNSQLRKLLDASGRTYPRKRWNSLSPLSRTVVKQCTNCYGPGHRPSFFDLRDDYYKGSYIQFDVRGWNAMSDDQLWRVMKGKECLYKHGLRTSPEWILEEKFDRYKKQERARKKRDNQRSLESERNSLVWEAFMTKSSDLAKRKRIKLYGSFTIDDTRQETAEEYDEDVVIKDAILYLMSDGK